MSSSKVKGGKPVVQAQTVQRSKVQPTKAPAPKALPVKESTWNTVLSGREYQLAEIIKTLGEKPRFTDVANAASEIMRINSSNVAALLNRMVDKGFLQKLGPARQHHYELSLPAKITVKQYTGPMKQTGPAIPVQAAPAPEPKTVDPNVIIGALATQLEQEQNRSQVLEERLARMEEQKLQAQTPSVNLELLKRVNRLVKVPGLAAMVGA